MNPHSRCPCGSKRSYRQCHGSLASWASDITTAYSAQVTSSTGPAPITQWRREVDPKRGAENDEG